MGDSPKAIRQRMKVKRVGIFNAFDPKSGKEISESEARALDKAARDKAKTMRGKKDTTKRRGQLDSAIDRMSRGQTTDSNN